jgi:hypothetical protein
MHFWPLNNLLKTLFNRQMQARSLGSKNISCRRHTLHPCWVIPPILPAETIYRGVQNFAQERSEELFATNLVQLKKLASVTFTVNQLASDYLRISIQAARNRIGPWQNSGAIKKIDEIENQGSRPLHLYGVSDMRLLIALFPKLEVRHILANWAFVCPSCGSVALSDRKEIVCECGERIASQDAKSLFVECSLKPL